MSDGYPDLDVLPAGVRLLRDSTYANRLSLLECSHDGTLLRPRAAHPGEVMCSLCKATGDQLGRRVKFLAHVAAAAIEADREPTLF